MYNNTLYLKTDYQVINKKTRRKIQKIKKMAKKHTKKVGFFRSIRLQCVGFSDGKRGLPKKAADDEWSSPYMHKTMKDHEVFVQTIWAMLQNEHEEVYVEIEKLLTTIQQNKALAESNHRGLKQMETEQEKTKPGEEHLPKSTVSARREAERARDPRHRMITTLKQQVLESERKLMVLISYLEEDCNTVRLISQAARDSMLQRLDIYWNAAQRRHPKKDEMPVVPNQDRFVFAEEYMKLHEEKMTRVKQVMQYLLEKSGQEVA